MSLMGRLRNVLKVLLERRILDYLYESELVHVRRRFGSFKTYNVSETSTVRFLEFA